MISPGYYAIVTLVMLLVIVCKLLSLLPGVISEPLIPGGSDSDGEIRVTRSAEQVNHVLHGLMGSGETQDVSRHGMAGVV